MNIKHHITDYILTTVFNMYFDPYTLLLLSNTSSQTQRIYKTTQAKALSYILKKQNKQDIKAIILALNMLEYTIPFESIACLMDDLLVLELDDCEYDKGMIGKVDHCYYNPLYFIAYDGSLDYFNDKSNESYQESLTILCDIISTLVTIKAYKVVDEMVNTFLSSDYLRWITLNPSLFGNWSVSSMLIHIDYMPTNQERNDMMRVITQLCSF